MPDQDQTNLDNIMKESPNAAVSPPQNTEAFYADSFAEVLVKSIGYYVACEFLIGTNNIVLKEGILYAAGVNFVTLRDPDTDAYTICDMYALKFATVYPMRARPGRGMAGNTYMRPQQGMMQPGMMPQQGMMQPGMPSGIQTGVQQSFG